MAKCGTLGSVGVFSKYSLLPALLNYTALFWRKISNKFLSGFQEQSKREFCTQNGVKTPYSAPLRIFFKNWAPHFFYKFSKIILKGDPEKSCL